MSNEQLLDQPGSRVIDLDIEGMTCASCVNRVERKLGKLDGVEATVNLPLESARVTVPADITDDQITATVAAAGYKATVRSARYPGTPAEDAGLPAGTEFPAGTAAPSLRPRLVVAAVLTVPVFADLDDPGIPVPELGLGGRRSWPCRWSPGRRGRSTAPRPSTRGIWPPPWTPWCPSA